MSTVGKEKEKIKTKGLSLKIKTIMDKRANNNSANSSEKTTNVSFYST